MKFAFGRRSKIKLSTCEPVLQQVVEKALSYGVMDISVLEGARTLEKQQEYFKAGKSKLDGVSKKSKHQISTEQPMSLAVDVMPYPGEVNGVSVWQDTQRWCVLAGLMFAAASELGVEIRWGGDWDGDGNNADSKFLDYPHYELIKRD